jgi:hypothetical protein
MEAREASVFITTVSGSAIMLADVVEAALGHAAAQYQPLVSITCMLVGGSIGYYAYRQMVRAWNP